MTHFIKECRQLSKSLIVLIYVGVIVLFYVSQLGNYAGDDIFVAQNSKSYSSGNPLMSPPEGLESYGNKPSDNTDRIMTSATHRLAMEYNNNSYATYPFGFYKNYVPNQSEQEEIKGILTDITGVTFEELLSKIDKKHKEYEVITSDIDFSDVIPIAVDYTEFMEKMTRLTDILGSGSNYSGEFLKTYALSPITYEEKLAEYNAFISEDRITGAYARLFCDYMGIAITMFSVFVPVSFFMRDRRAKVKELVYSRGISSAKMILIRYAALLVMQMLPIFLLSVVPTVQLVSYGNSNGIDVDLFAFLKYITGWLLPSLMTTTAVAAFITVLTETPLAIAVQFLWSFLDIASSGIGALNGGNYGTQFAIRHNTVGNLRGYLNGLSGLIINRASYAGFAVILVCLTILIYEQKRRGRLNVGDLRKVFSNSKNSV